jgi:hypothetical protein
MEYILYYYYFVLDETNDALVARQKKQTNSIEAVFLSPSMT